VARELHNMTDYAATVRDFKLEVPRHFNFAREVIDRWAQDPEKLAMHWLGPDGGERRLSFRHFAERSDRFAAVLQRRGVRPGDRVMVQLPRVPERWEVLLGCFKAGAVAVPGTVLLTPKDIRYRTELAEGVAYVCDADNAAKVDQVRPECPSLRELFQVGGEPGAGWASYEAEVEAAEAPREVATLASDPALIYFTSGTVGNPKMVLHTHASYPIGHVVTGRFWLDLRPEDQGRNRAEAVWGEAAWPSLFARRHRVRAVDEKDARGKFAVGEAVDLLECHLVINVCALLHAARCVGL